MRGLRLLAAGVWWVSASCTALREVPRAQYAAREERRRVAVDTHEGQHYEFDYARFDSDTLFGYRRRDTEGAFEEFESIPIPLEGVAKLSARRVDWYRTGLIGGGVLAAVVGVALAKHVGSGGGSSKPPCPEEPCP